MTMFDVDTRQQAAEPTDIDRTLHDMTMLGFALVAFICAVAILVVLRL